MPYLKPQINFSLNFASLFSVMRNNSSLLLQLKLYMIWTKGIHQSANLRLLTTHMKFGQICTLIGSFCWKCIKLQLKSIEEFFLMTLKSDAKFEEKLIFFFRNDKKLVTFDLNTWYSQNILFDWFLLCKVYNVWPKKVQRSYLSWHWRVMLNLKKNWLVVWKNDMRNLTKFDPSTRKSQKSAL